MNKSIHIGKLGEDRKCPYCNHGCNYHDVHSIMDDTNECPNCNKEIIFSLEIYPKNRWDWVKPSILVDGNWVSKE